MQGEFDRSGPAPLPHAAKPSDLPHGGRLLEARRRFPTAPEPFLDLSTGINPMPYPIPELPREAWSRLPEPEALDTLQAAAAHRFRLSDPAMVVAAPGSQLLISLLPHLLGCRTAAILGPTYNEHRAAWHAAGAQTTETTTLDTPADALILCNPNNPDGTRHDPAALRARADAQAARNGILVVDEAFADFDPALSLAPALPHPALIVLRSFGKAYGLAGLRLGFALCAPARARRLRAALGPWALSGPALQIGTAALRNDAWHTRTAEALAGAAARLDTLLEAAGLTIRGGTTLFRLAETPEARTLSDRLGAAGILVRRFDAHPTWLRFGLPPDQPAWDRLATALRT